MQLNWKKSFSVINRYSLRIVIVWILFWFFCRPVLVIHYSPDASETLGYFLLENYDTLKEVIEPGENIRFFMDMFPEPDELIIFSLPASSQEWVEIKYPFSRVDIYINADSRIERTRISQAFLERFYEPDE